MWHTFEEPVSIPNLSIFTAHIKHLSASQSWVILIPASGSMVELTSFQMQWKEASAF